jgi:hypothetical protein
MNPDSGKIKPSCNFRSPALQQPACLLEIDTLAWLAAGAGRDVRAVSRFPGHFVFDQSGGVGSHSGGGLPHPQRGTSPGSYGHFRKVRPAQEHGPAPCCW